jgi:tyrosine-protein kinase Etk/Wzc
MNPLPDDHRQIKGTISGDNILGEFDFPKFWKLTRKSGIAISLFFLIGLIGAWAFLRYTVPLFESSSVLKLDIKSDSGILGLETGPRKGGSSNNLSGEIELIKSDLLHDLVIDSLPELNISYYAKGKIKHEERFKSSPFRVEVINPKSPPLDVPINIAIIDRETFELELEQEGGNIENRFRFGELIKGENADFRITIKDVDQEEFNSEGYYFVLNSRNSLLKYLRDNLIVETLNHTANTIRISFRDPNRFKTKEIVNTINAVYLSETLALKNKASSQTIYFLNNQLERTDSLLGNSEKEIEDFIRTYKTTNILEEVDEVSLQIEELNQEIGKTRLELNWIDQFESKIGEIDSLDEYLEIGYFPSENMARSADEIVRIHQEFKKIKYSSKQTTLLYRTKKEQYDNALFQLKVTIRDEKKRLLESMDLLRKKSRSMEEELAKLPERRTEYNRLKRYYDLNEKFYLLLMDKKAEYGISEAGTVPEFQILSSASLPSARISPKSLNTYLAGIGGALIISLFFVFVRFLTHNTFESIEELENLVTTPILGAIPGKKKLNSGYSQLVVHDNPKSAISEAFRTIRTNLDFISPNGSHNLISVSSTVSGEGKTFVAINLGAIIAMSNKKVVILDLDMRKPKIHHAFEAENEKGMSNILIGRDGFSDCLKPTGLENLYYIPSGPVPPNPSELIMLDSFDLLLEDLSKEFDLIIMDSPPVGLVTDGVLLMKKAQIPLYVVRAHFTKKGFNRVIENLTQKNQISNLSIVFNGQSQGSGSKYGYGYGYGAGYYEEKESKKGIKGFFGL